MRKLALTLAFAMVGLSVGSAAAFECPTLIKQAREALEQFRRTPGLAAIKDAKIAAVETNLQAAESAHSAGQHDEATRQAKEALKVLGK
jgi:hypothetical protein